MVYIISFIVFAFQFVFAGATISILQRQIVLHDKMLDLQEKNSSQTRCLQRDWLLSYKKILWANRANVKHQDVLCNEGGHLQIKVAAFDEEKSINRMHCKI